MTSAAARLSSIIEAIAAARLSSGTSRRLSAVVMIPVPSALVKAPTLILIKYVVGYTIPMTAAAPLSDATGVIIPENCVAGIVVAMAVPKIAAIWVFANDDMNNPNPVVAKT